LSGPVTRPSIVHRILAEHIDDGKAIFSAEEAHHLVRVLRLRPGDPFVAHDGKGGVYLCRLHKRQDLEPGYRRRRHHQTEPVWEGEIVRTLTNRMESPLSICLGQSLIKKDKFEWVIQKAVELGVSEIVPLISWRTEIRTEEGGVEHRMKRWQKILVEAFKQSARSRLPRLNEPVRLAIFLERWQADLRFVLDEQEGIHLRDVLRTKPGASSCLFLVGPEGGWDERDRVIMRSHAVTPVHLGSRILRTETAPITVMSILQYELGDLGPAETNNQ
jgi:16S rRNA (uracil1498-N3)-methyltransferase